MVAAVRRSLLSVIIGLAGVAVLIGAGWAVQDVGLPRPAPADRVAADAEAWLNYHRFSIAIFHSDDRRFRGACLRGWYPHLRGRQARGSLITFTGGHVALATAKGRVQFASGRRWSEFPASLAVASGCTASLANELNAATQSGLRLDVDRAYAANQPALTLRLPRIRDERLVLYVSPRGYKPLVTIVHRDGHTASARLYLTRATASRAAEFRRLVPRTPHG